MTRRTVRVFLDSNVILSGLLSERGAPRILLDVLSLGFPFLSGLTGRYNILEIERTLKAKLPSLAPVYRRYIPKLRLRIIPLPPTEEIRRFSGKVIEKDVPVIVSAIRGKADFLVTGDKRHFANLKSQHFPFEIVTPSEFVDVILPRLFRDLGNPYEPS
jgi:predicted nucleic acid-binding protein